MTATTTYAADDTALLIVDPYNDFMSEGGKLYERTKETAKAVGFYDNIALLPYIQFLFKIKPSSLKVILSL
jgi:hypothetical protein